MATLASAMSSSRADVVVGSRGAEEPSSSAVGIARAGTMGSV